jgi:WXG100 family type VII secretion target
MDIGGENMSGVIRLTPEELRGVARQYNTESSNVTELISRLDQMSNMLQGIWEGASSEAFIQQYHELRPSFEKMAVLLNEIAQQLHNSATILEETDQQIAGQIRG